MAKKISSELAAEIAAFNFEQAIGELEEIVRRLESGEVGLEESIALYERGDLLKKHCQSKLRIAGEKVEKIIVGGDGTAEGADPLDVD